MMQVESGQDAPLFRRLFYVGSLSLVVIATLLLGLGNTRLWDRDEPRNARCTAEMLESGDWVVPSFNGQLRTHKPILLYWLEGACFLVWGEDAWSARFPSAMMGIASLLAILSFVGSWSRTTAWWVVVSLSTCAMFVMAARAATPDACLIGCSAWAVIGLVRSNWMAIGESFEPSPNRTWLVVGYSAMGFAVLAKGPVGIVMPSLVAGIWLWNELAVNRQQDNDSRLDRRKTTTWIPGNRLRMLSGRIQELASPMLGWVFDWRSGFLAFKRLEPWWGIPLALAIAVPWYFWVEVRTDGLWLKGFFWEHNVGRAMQSMEGHQGGIWYYPLALLVGTFPWSLLLIPIVGWGHARSQNQSAEGRALRLGRVWVLAYLAVFTLARTKLPSYITPCYVGAALWIGVFLKDWARGECRLSNSMLRLASAVSLSVALGIGIAIAVAEYRAGIPIFNPMAIAVVSLVLTGVLTLAASFVKPSQWQKSQKRLPILNMVGGVIAIVSFFVLAAPRFDAKRTDLDGLLVIQSRADSSFREQQLKEPENQAMPVAFEIGSTAGVAKGPRRQGRWMAIGTIEPSWVFYLRESIQEVLADDQWKAKAMDHLVDSEHLLILPSSMKSELESNAQERGWVLEELSQLHRFLKSDSFSVMHRIPRIADRTLPTLR